MKVVIFAGGSGTRLWPVSRRNTPKQAQPFGDKETLLQKTYRRVRSGWPASDILVSTGIEQLPLIRSQLGSLPRKNYIVEPTRRDTSAAIGLAATYLAKKNPREVLVTAWADAYIKETSAYVKTIKTVSRVIHRHPDQTVLVGIKPRYADTGLGYIKMKRQVDSEGDVGVFSVDRFIEKPPQATAERFVRSWQYLWNPGMFAFRVDAILDKYRRWLNPSYKIMMKISNDIGTNRESSTVRRLFPKMQKIAIDYGIMEHDRDMLVVPSELTWSDIGNWRTIHEMLATHPDENILHGKHLTIDSRGNMLFSYSGKLIAAVGLHDMIVIETEDAILVCPKSRAQDVKQVVSELEAKKLIHLL